MRKRVRERVRGRKRMKNVKHKTVCKKERGLEKERMKSIGETKEKEKEKKSPKFMALHFKKSRFAVHMKNHAG